MILHASDIFSHSAECPRVHLFEASSLFVSFPSFPLHVSLSFSPPKWGIVRPFAPPSHQMYVAGDNSGVNLASSAQTRFLFRVWLLWRWLILGFAARGLYSLKMRFARIPTSLLDLTLSLTAPQLLPILGAHFPSSAASRVLPKCLPPFTF